MSSDMKQCHLLTAVLRWLCHIFVFTSPQARAELAMLAACIRACATTLVVHAHPFHVPDPGPVGAGCLLHGAPAFATHPPTTCASLASSASCSDWFSRLLSSLSCMFSSSPYATSPSFNSLQRV